MDICKPETISEVSYLESKLDTVTLWPDHENNVRLLTTRMMTVLQETHAKTGASSYTDQRFITNLICAISTSPTEKFQNFVNQIKSSWIMEDISDPAKIILKLDNASEHGRRWHLAHHEQEGHQDCCPHLRPRERPKEIWQVGKEGELLWGWKEGRRTQKRRHWKALLDKDSLPRLAGNQEGQHHQARWKEVRLCSQHTSKDGSINGLYMPAPHNHDAWAKAKAEQNKRFRENRKRDSKKTTDNAAGSAKKPKPAGNKLKLALSDRLTSALVTQYHMSHNNADELFQSAYFAAAQEN